MFFFFWILGGAQSLLSIHLDLQWICKKDHHPRIQSLAPCRGAMHFMGYLPTIVIIIPDRLNSKRLDDPKIVNSKMQICSPVTNLCMCPITRLSLWQQDTQGLHKPLGTSHKCYCVQCVFSIWYYITCSYCSFVSYTAPFYYFINLFTSYEYELQEPLSILLL